jgi:hypothetical protein
MKNLKRIIAEVKANTSSSDKEFNNLLWQLICYAPKMPVRLQQQQLLDEAETFTLKANDAYFAQSNLEFNCFKWGNGKRKVLLTHGWGSKAADFTEIITMLRQINNLEIIAFDAPGNGSSQGELSNLLLFVEGVKQIIKYCGAPDVFIGHSLGSTANIMAIQETEIKPSLLISISMLVWLKENFESSMQATDVLPDAREAFLNSFEVKFGKPASYYNLQHLYKFNGKHWLAYDEQDMVSPYEYINEIVTANETIQAANFEETGHERLVRSPGVIDKIKNLLEA